MIYAILSRYSFSYPKALVYMLQQSEYEPGRYLAWFWHARNFSTVMHRGNLTITRPSRLLLLALRIGIAIEIIGSMLCLYAGFVSTVHLPFYLVGALFIILYPFLWAHLILLPLIIGRIVITNPKNKKAITRAEAVFKEHPSIRVGILGSYGKTSMKELLALVLGYHFKVAATPANKNVAAAHAQFAQNLTGDEDILLIEYGEGQPGDIARFAENTHPTHAVITGIAPAHLDHYKTIENATSDILSISSYVTTKNIYMNESALAYANTKQARGFNLYSQTSALGWTIHSIDVSIHGTKFTMKKGKDSLELTSGLLGRHQVGPLAFAAAFALQLGMKDKDVQAAIKQTMPYSHRMQPYALGGAQIIDDTYNGNIEGIRAGLVLLKELPARRKVYVTPGLVDQGDQTASIHTEIGHLIADAHPDLVVLMHNSVTSFIEKGLQEAGFTGTLKIEKDPLAFYSNLGLSVAGGDVVLMQNDWPDQYA